MHTEPDSGKEKSVPPEISKDEEDELTLLESQENSEGPVTQADASVKKEDVLEKAREELAEQIAKMVTSESPQSGGERGIALDDLISSLDFNPFLTRKQIPRTPENLRKSKMLCLCNMLSLMTNVASSLTLYVSHKKKRIIHSVKLHGTLTAHLCNTG